MKIGVFSDVHGHFDELKKTLALLERLQVDALLCGGDLVDKGLHSDDVIDLMRERGIPCVQGNHDMKALFMWLPDHEPLRDSSILYLQTLPPFLTCEWAGKRVYMTHSNPWEDSSIYVYPARPMALFKEIADAVDAEVIVLGHTHQPMRVEVDGKVIVNPGSIYGNRGMDERTCGVLTLPECSFEIYDIDSGIKLSLFNPDVPL
jgi:putative phosphoesterase